MIEMLSIFVIPARSRIAVAVVLACLAGFAAFGQVDTLRIKFQPTSPGEPLPSLVDVWIAGQWSALSNQGVDIWDYSYSNGVPATDLWIRIDATTLYRQEPFDPTIVWQGNRSRVVISTETGSIEQTGGVPSNFQGEQAGGPPGGGGGCPNVRDPYGPGLHTWGYSLPMRVEPGCVDLVMEWFYFEPGSGGPDSESGFQFGTNMFGCLDGLVKYSHEPLESGYTFWKPPHEIFMLDNLSGPLDPPSMIPSWPNDPPAGWQALIDSQTPEAALWQQLWVEAETAYLGFVEDYTAFYNCVNNIGEEGGCCGPEWCEAVLLHLEAIQFNTAAMSIQLDRIARALIADEDIFFVDLFIEYMNRPDPLDPGEADDPSGGDDGDLVPPGLPDQPDPTRMSDSFVPEEHPTGLVTARGLEKSDSEVPNPIEFDIPISDWIRDLAGSAGFPAGIGVAANYNFVIEHEWYGEMRGIIHSILKSYCALVGFFIVLSGFSKGGGN